MKLNSCKLETECLMMELERLKFIFDEVRKYGEHVPNNEHDRRRMFTFIDMTDEEIERITKMVSEFDHRLDQAMDVSSPA